ncbi:cation:dicarboxylate symporter family transporter [Aquirhabdus sp.]|uniref:cation:dicarboxylate symporter family transporter n=1 Tax=Aquirhabdus sp. TaxID=2824160 RepID=UPI00396D04A9
MADIDKPTAEVRHLDYAAPPPPKKSGLKFPSLAWQIVIGLIAGIVVGWLFAGQEWITTWVAPLGDIFIRLIKMIVVPIVISTLIVGVAGTGDIKALGRLGGKTLLYFELVTTVAIIVGMFFADILQPGTGIQLSGLTKTDISSYVATEHTVAHHSFADTFVHVIPTNIIDALAKGDMLAIIFFSVMFGLGLASLGEKGKPMVNMFALTADSMFWITRKIMQLAPLGVFGLMAVAVSKFGLSALIPLAKLVGVVYLAMFTFVFVVFGLIARWVGIRLLELIKLLREELVLAYSTASSETVLPRLIEKMQTFGVPKHIVAFVIPTGYSFNLDGSTLYQSIAALFLAQLYGIDLSLGQQITLILVLMLTSKGIAGVPGVSFVVLLATLGSVGIPAEGLAFIAGIDRIMDMARTAVNVIGNALASVVISRWEGQFRTGDTTTIAEIKES